MPPTKDDVKKTFLPDIHKTAVEYEKNLLDKDFFVFTNNALQPSPEYELTVLTFAKKNFAHLVGITPSGSVRSSAKLFDLALANTLTTNDFKLNHRSDLIRNKFKAASSGMDIMSSGLYMGEINGEKFMRLNSDKMMGDDIGVLSFVYDEYNYVPNSLIYADILEVVTENSLSEVQGIVTRDCHTGDLAFSLQNKSLTPIELNKLKSTIIEKIPSYCQSTDFSIQVLTGLNHFINTQFDHLLTHTAPAAEATTPTLRLLNTQVHLNEYTKDTDEQAYEITCLLLPNTVILNEGDGLYYEAKDMAITPEFTLPLTKEQYQILQGQIASGHQLELTIAPSMTEEGLITVNCGGAPSPLKSYSITPESLFNNMEAARQDWLESLPEEAPVYYGMFANERTRQQIIDNISDLYYGCDIASPPLTYIVKDMHITYGFQTDIPGVFLATYLEPYSDLSATNLEFKVIGYGNDGQNEGLLVEPSIDNSCAGYNGAQAMHITTQLAQGAKPTDTASLDFKELPEELQFHITLEPGYLSQDGQVVIAEKARGLGSCENLGDQEDYYKAVSQYRTRMGINASTHEVIDTPPTSTPLKEVAPPAMRSFSSTEDMHAVTSRIAAQEHTRTPENPTRAATHLQDKPSPRDRLFNR